MIPRTLPRLLAAAAAAAALACAGPATSSGGAPPPGAAAGDGGGGADGARIYRAHCASCHRLRDPGERTQAAWAKAVREMSGRAHLSADDERRVLAYLQAHAKDAASP